jgi:hypothetical protein
MPTPPLSRWTLDLGEKLGCSSSWQAAKIGLWVGDPAY